MSNPNYSTILTHAIESRTRKLADNISRDNAVIFALKEHDGIKPFTGGTKILQEIMHVENGNSGSYAALDTLPTAAVDFATAAEYGIKQYSSAVILSGLQLAQASGKERMIDLMESAITNAEISLTNKMVQGLYSDGTGNSGKDLSGLQAALPVNPATGTYGGINRATATYWRHKAVTGTAVTSANVWSLFLNCYLQTCRGVEKPDVAISPTGHYTALLSYMQAQQRFTESNAKLTKAGFTNVMFMDTPVTLENDSAGTGMPSTITYFLNTKYIKLRPYGSMDFQSFGTDPDNQDATVKRMKWYGNLTSSRQAAQGIVSDL